MKKIAVVTGGTRGIGKAIVEDLVKNDYFVYTTYRSNEDAADALKHLLIHVETLAADVSDYDKAKEVVSFIAKKEGRIDLLVNNAGITKDKGIAYMNKKSWNDVIDTNLTGTFNYAKFTSAVMMEQNNGNIINISSIASRYALAGQSNYSASKAAVEAFTRVLAKELIGHNIRVNSVSPGFIDTEMVTASNRENVFNNTVIKRLGNPDEVAAAVMFLAGSQSSYITGQNIVIDGGLSL